MGVTANLLGVAAGGILGGQGSRESRCDGAGAGRCRCRCRCRGHQQGHRDTDRDRDRVFKKRLTAGFRGPGQWQQESARPGYDMFWGAVLFHLVSLSSRSFCCLQLSNSLLAIQVNRRWNRHMPHHLGCYSCVQVNSKHQPDMVCLSSIRPR